MAFVVRSVPCSETIMQGYPRLPRPPLDVAVRSVRQLEDDLVTVQHVLSQLLVQSANSVMALKRAPAGENDHLGRIVALNVGLDVSGHAAPQMIDQHLLA